MTINDDRIPSPTDPPLDPIRSEIAQDAGDDTAGHSMLNAELGRTIAREHVREADQIARNGARVREARKGTEGGFIKRFLGR